MTGLAARGQPPALQNFRYLEYLGGGGFADVFLYEQIRPVRKVAVKVLRAGGLDAKALHSFDDEANLMAQVSAHPYIVTMHEAERAPDGRPYLVMEYYPPPHLGDRAKKARLSVAETLKLGVQIASAVETAHRSGIVHRDIKPANILVSQFGRPGLTDFGIAGAREGDSFSESQGVSIPFAPPEVLLQDDAGDERGDVYSFAATLYALLAGRSPYEVNGGDNRLQALSDRILRAPLPPIGRSDVPPSLELLLGQALSRDPSQRPQSAAELARALQGIERELGYSPTLFELEAEPVAEPEPLLASDDAEGTRASRLQVVRQEEPRARVPISGVPGTFADQPVAAAHVPAPRAPAIAPAVEAVTQARSQSPMSALEDGSVPGQRQAPWLAIAGGGLALVVLVSAILAVALGSGGRGTSTSTTVKDTGGNALVIGTAPPTPTNLDVKLIDGGSAAQVTWVPGDSEPTTYRIFRDDDRAATTLTSDTPTVRIEGLTVGVRPCVHVLAIRDGEGSAPTPTKCSI